MDYSSYLVTTLYGVYSVPCAIHCLSHLTEVTENCALRYFHDTDDPINIRIRMANQKNFVKFFP